MRTPEWLAEDLADPEIRWLLRVGGSVIAVIVVLCAVLVYFANRDQDRWEAWCAEQDGHVDSHTSTSPTTTYNAQGQPTFGTTISTTHFCLTEDGRIIDIR